MTPKPPSNPYQSPTEVELPTKPRGFMIPFWIMVALSTITILFFLVAVGGMTWEALRLGLKPECIQILPGVAMLLVPGIGMAFAARAFRRGHGLRGMLYFVLSCLVIVATYGALALIDLQRSL